VGKRAIRVATDYFDSGKVRKLEALFGPQAAIYPIRLWAYCGKNHPISGAFEGFKDDLTDEFAQKFIEQTARWDGGGGVLVKALMIFKFLDKTDAGVYSIHDWAYWQKILASKDDDKPVKREWDLGRPVNRIIAGYKVAKGFAYDDRVWDKHNFVSHLRPAKKFLDAFGGSVNDALRYLDSYGQWMNERQYSWNLHKIAARAWEDQRTSEYRQTPVSV
jgi:hypothetical protein